MMMLYQMVVVGEGGGFECRLIWWSVGLVESVGMIPGDEEKWWWC